MAECENRMGNTAQSGSAVGGPGNYCTEAVGSTHSVRSCQAAAAGRSMCKWVEMEVGEESNSRYRSWGEKVVVGS